MQSSGATFYGSLVCKSENQLQVIKGKITKKVQVLNYNQLPDYIVYRITSEKIEQLVHQSYLGKLWWLWLE